jgi:uncharacterized protein YaeQ
MLSTTMALSATAYHLQISLSDVDRSVYETLDLRMAMHPSESMRYFLLRTIAYCMEFQEGLAFSKGGLSSNEEAPLAVHDLTGQLQTWIDIGAPSAERLHKASKAANRVALYTYVSAELLRKEAATRAIYKLESIDVFRFPQAFLTAFEAQISRNIKFDVTRNEETLYVTINGETLESKIEKVALAALL